MCTRADGPGQGSVILLPICSIPKFYIVLDLAVTATTTTTTTTTYQSVTALMPTLGTRYHLFGPKRLIL